MKKIHFIVILAFVVAIILLLCLCSNCKHSKHNGVVSADSIIPQKNLGDTLVTDTFDVISFLEDTTFQEESMDDIEMEELDSVDRALLMLLPAPISKYPEQILIRKSYILSYNRELRLPNWVAWHLTADHTDGKYKWKNSFREDVSVPTPRATVSDYKGSGWSRGHMCPSGDNKWDSEANYQTFLMTNVCPQDAKLNSGLWNSIEMDCRKWAKQFGDIFIVCGPLPLKKTYETIGYNKVAVPRAFFKVVLCLRNEPNGFGFVVKNNDGQKKNDLYYNSIREVEKVTGYDFFPLLNDSLEDIVETKVDTFLWYPKKKHIATDSLKIKNGTS